MAVSAVARVNGTMERNGMYVRVLCGKLLCTVLWCSAAFVFLFSRQDERDRVLHDFKEGRTLILVATDVAARGLDVKDIRVVINFDFPKEMEVCF